jgi:hypothetical protein
LKQRFTEKELTPTISEAHIAALLWISSTMEFEVLRRNEVPEEVLTTIRDLIKQMYGI